MNPLVTWGSHEVAADKVGRQLLQVGASNLKAKIGSYYASFGDTCWRDDSTTRLHVKRWDGRPYHRESIGRARRQMARMGWIESTRVMPQQTPRGADRPSTHGTTSKSISWKVLGLRNPLSRGENRKRREVQRSQDRAERVETTPRPRVALEPSLIALVAGIGSTPTSPAPSSRPRTRTDRPIDRAHHDEGDSAARAAEARRRLEAWRRDNPEDGGRGPP